MASIMIGVAGVAQQLKTANAGGGEPTGVSLATSSSGDYNNACMVYSPDNDGSGNDWIDENG